MNALSPRILLVASDLTEIAVIEQALVEANYRVSVARTYKEGARQLGLDRPDLLIAALRLEAFNGLHLLIRCWVNHPHLPVIIVGASEDFTPDISRYGGRFQAYPVETESLVRLVSELLPGTNAPETGTRRRWQRKQTELEAVVRDTPARVVDLSYGGLRLEMPVGALEEVHGPLQIRLPTLGLSVTALPRWWKQREGIESSWCGAEIAAAGADATRVWRDAVDSLN